MNYAINTNMNVIKIYKLRFYPGDKLGDVLIDIMSRCIERMRNDVEVCEIGISHAEFNN